MNSTPPSAVPRSGNLLRAGLWQLLILLLLGGIANGTPASPSPNIVLIISDDQAWTDYSFMGHPSIQTPRLDQLASQSLRFRRGYVPSSLCCPSLASILTGRYPHEHRVTSNDPALPRDAGLKPGQPSKDPTFLRQRSEMQGFIEQTPTLTRILGARGYLSFQAGKWWQGHHSRGGFTHGMTTGDPEKGGRHGDEGLEIGRKTMQPVYDFIDAATRQEKPFLLWYAPMMPHDPHTPPDRLLKKYQARTNSIHVARYWAMVEWFDETCGQLLDYLDQKQIATNTIVVYVTDNGWIQDAQTNRYAPRSKQSPYEGGLRTPILIRWPGHVSPREASQLATSLDLMPTLLAATGTPAPPGLPGVNLLDRAATRRRSTVFGECFTHNAVNLDHPASSLRWRWLIEGHYKLIVPAPWNETNSAPELYNLALDPAEAHNLAADQPRRVARLRRALDAWWTPQPGPGPR